MADGVTTESNTRRHAVRVRVNDAELEFLRRLGERDDRSISSVLRVALREFYDRELERSREDVLS